MYELNGKISVVTGASRGIGEASARALDAAVLVWSSVGALCQIWSGWLPTLKTIR